MTTPAAEPPRGMRVRTKLALSYAGFVMIAGVLLLAVVWLFLLRYVPREAALTPGPFTPGRDDLIRAFTPPAIWSLVFLLVFALVGGWMLAGRMLAPLEKITRATRLASGGSLGHRIALDGPHDEFRELADSFDAMLARIEAHVAEQQRFAAGASHELRTPLAITQAMLEVAAVDPDRDADALIARLRAVNTRAIDLTEALLLLSRAERGDLDAEAAVTVDLSLLVDEAIETLLPLAESRGVALESTGVPATTRGSRALLLQLTTNLVHNAIVHNLPAGGTVHVSTTVTPDSASLVVANTGELLDSALVPTLTEPFQRGAGRARTAGDGVGLGLAIVAGIVRVHRGSLVLSPVTTGGLEVTVRLPRTP